CAQCDAKAAFDRRDPLGGFVPSGGGKAALGVLRNGAQRGGPAGSAETNPGAARRVLEKSACDGIGRGAEPVAGKSRASGGLYGVRRADVPGRAATKRILRRSFP